jgi:hypothetical protein
MFTERKGKVMCDQTLFTVTEKKNYSVSASYAQLSEQFHMRPGRLE